MTETRLFISHASEDKPFVNKLVRDLKIFAGNVWLDIWELKVGDSLKKRLKAAIHKNDYFAIVLSPRSIKSKWVKYELSEALIKELIEKKVVILPIMYEECKAPKSIGDKIYADFRKKYDAGLIAVLKAIAQDKNRELQIDSGFLGVHTDIPSIFLERLCTVEKKVSLNAVFYPLFTFTAVTHSIAQSIENHGCEYEVLFQNPKSKCIKEITPILRKEYTVKQFRDEINTNVDNFKRLRDKYPSHIHLKWTDLLPTFPMVIMDQRVFVGSYAYSSPAPSGIWIEVTMEGSISKRFCEHYEYMWDKGFII